MRFVLHQAALNGADDTLARLDRVVDRIADEVHEIEVPDADLLEGSQWYASARQTRRKLVKKAVAAPVRAGGNTSSVHAKTLSVSSAADAELADKLAHTPLILLVEDRESDGVLIEILAEECGTAEFTKFWAASQRCSPKAVEIDTAGGVSAMPARIARAAQDAASEGRPLRMVAVCDSDARWPGDQGHGSVHDLVNVSNACTAYAVPLHVLKKRCAENYIPDDVVVAARNDPRNASDAHRFDALLRRSPAQRDHFPIKDGLDNTERTAATSAGHYDPSEDADLDLLSTRLFPKRPRPMLRLHGERRAAFTGPGLLARDGNGEIDALLNLIASEV